MYTAQGTIDRTQTVRDYEPLVRRHALSLQVRLPAHIELDDLIQAGMVGLLEAFNRFDSKAGVKFSTYASQRIKGAMLDELRSRDWLPRSVRRGARELHEAIHKLQNELGREPSEREIIAEMQISASEYHKLLTDVNNGLILEYEDSDNDESKGSAVAGHHSPFSAPDQASFAAFEKKQLAAAIVQLPKREQTLLALYYQEELNLKEIGAVLEVSESRVCQLHSQAVARLKAVLRPA